LPNPRKTVVILQPSYLPWIGFFNQLSRSDVFVYYDDVQFDKHGWRNRNRIKTPSGPRWLTVPVRHRGLGRPAIRDIRIEAGHPWARKQAGTLRQFYSEAPFAEHYLDELESLLHRPWDFLVDLDSAVIRWLAKSFGIDRPFVFSSTLGIEGGRSERLARICENFGATHYLSGDAARDYLDESVFSSAGIAVEWQDFSHPVYPQRFDGFIPYLSAIDLLLNVGGESLKYIDGEGH